MAPGPEAALEIPLFPLKTVLFPGGRLPLRVFEQRYVEMTKACLRQGSVFGVCLIRQGEEVATAAASPPDVAEVGTTCRIAEWDMQQLGILQLVTRGEDRFRIAGCRVERNGLLVGEVEMIPAEPARAIDERYRPAASFVATVIARAGSEGFPMPLALEDASWVGYRIAELLPLPLPVKQGMLEISDAEMRLALLTELLRKHDLL